MLDVYFESAVRRQQLRRGPLAAEIDELAAAFGRARYAPTTARRLLSVIGQFSAYLGVRQVPVAALDEDIVKEFLAETPVVDGPRALRRVLDYLRTRALAPPCKPPVLPPFASTLADYDRYLRDVRGLAASTRQTRGARARALLDWLRARYGDAALVRLAGPDVLEFLTDALTRYASRSSRAHVSSDTRAFLRYLHASGTIPTDLTRTVPRVATPRLASLPRTLPWEQVQALIDGVETSHPDGLRDKAVLLVLATLGLRSVELRSLELTHIQWRAGALRVPPTKTRRERLLPLPHAVGVALADYVLHGRPPVAVPQVFLCHDRRPRPLTPNTVVWIVRRHLHRVGLQSPRAGAHLLRHSLASRLVNAGVPIKSVADVLGHVSIDTTAIYTKVDTATLATVALPFPGGAQ